MIEPSIPKRQLRRLEESIAGTKKKLPKEVAIAINKTTPAVTRAVAKAVQEHVKLPQKSIKEKMPKPKRASESQLHTVVKLKQSNRFGLRHFNAKQNKAGVKYTVSKDSGRQFIAGAFQGPKPGVMKTSWKGNVFKRAGKKRLPIVHLRGPSPWGVFVKNNKRRSVVKIANAELKKQIQKRVQFNLFKKQGAS